MSVRMIRSRADWRKGGGGGQPKTFATIRREGVGTCAVVDERERGGGKTDEGREIQYH